MFPLPGARVASRPPKDFLAAVSGFRPEDKKKSLMSRSFGGKSEIEQIRWYDENGPSVIGFYLDLKASMIRLVDYKVQVWDKEEADWVWSENPEVQAIPKKHLLGLHNESLHEIAAKIAREIEAVGEVGFAKIVKDDIVQGYTTVPLDPGSYEVLESDKDGYPLRIAVKMTRGAKGGRGVDYDSSTDFMVLDTENIHRVFKPHPRWLDEPFTPLVRALPDIRRYDNSGRALHRAIASVLLLARVLWFKGSKNDIARVKGQGHELGHLGHQLAQLTEFSERAITDYDETEIQSAMAYPIVSEEPPQLIEIGKVIEPEILEVKKDALGDVARGLNIPMSVLVEGQGAAQRMLNEWLQDKAFKETAIFPLARLVANGLTACFLQPKLDELGYEGQAYRIWPDEITITDEEPEDEKPSLDQLLEAVCKGIISPRAFVEKAGLDESYLLDRPEGIDDWAWFQMIAKIAETEGEEPAAFEARASAGWADRLW